MGTKLASFAARPLQTATDQVFDTLYQAIISLELPPGTKMSEAEIAGRLDVSRQPVRDAFYRLSKIGLLEVRPQRATLVTKISETAVLNAAFVRIALEVECLRAAFEQDGERLIVQLRDNIAAQQHALDSTDPAAFHALDEEFHRLICEHAGHEHVWGLIQDHKAHLDRVRYLTLSQAHRARVRGEHNEILSALEADNFPLAELNLRRHLTGIKPHLESLRVKHAGYFEERP
ncbi:GntR family transcriptional regulator [Maritalea mediterranea]|uniref:GntR family transcriptional regulator n=1 Tax=Maritalea mediterranea TaxID=2909667 RepID=A0ABS9EBS4_9HYPH|nr:GntR family transcriptional regulator [Maritalea mediterranea]MCF4099344.1 GntR family transcriptional regulator [Maritalea mediterranea]